jgi:hypothetical protein
MSKKAKLLMQVIGLSTALISGVSMAASDKGAETDKGFVLFKIHDIVPEKNADGNVVYCNIGATFFNRTKNDVANLAISLNWNDDVIGEIMDVEEREEREKKRSKSKEPKSRYSTSSFTSEVVSLDLKLPPIKANQQITLKTKVDTDRCFILLNDMDILINNCGTLSASSSKDACANYFQYISPKNGEYYTEFKKISLEEELSNEDAHVVQVQNDINKVFEETISSIDRITAPVPQSD